MAEAHAPQAPGPIFLVGLSRSGTKLLRELLNNHPAIRFVRHESHFVPSLIARLEGRHRHVDEAGRRAFTRYFRRTGFCRLMARSGTRLDDGTLWALTDRATWPDVIDSLFRHYTGAPCEQSTWGDKSPSYIWRMFELRHYFPSARFIHIIRDPRDRAVSAHRAWGASPLISAQQWLEAVLEADRFASAFPAQYRLVRYEDLVADTAAVMQSLCDYLSVPFMPDLERLRQRVETRGDPDNPTRQRADVFAGNVGQYRGDLSPRCLTRIEAITFPAASTFGYAPSRTPAKHRALTRGEWLLACPRHYWGGLRLFIARWGVIGGLEQAWQRSRA